MLPKQGQAQPVGTPLPDLSFLTRPTFKDLEDKQAGYANDAFAPDAPPAQAFSKKDLPLLLLGLLGASAFGVKPKQIGQEFQGFMGARQAGAEQRNQENQRAGQLKRDRAKMEYARIGDQIESQNKEFDFQRGVKLEEARDTRNFNQTRTLAKEDDDRAAAQKALDREARTKSAAGVSLRQATARNMGIIKDLPNEVDRAEGMRLNAQREASFYGDAPPLTVEENAKLDAIIAKQTLTGQGKEIKNASDKKKFDFLDKTLQVDYDNKVATLGLRNLSSKLKEKDLQYYDDNQKFKRLMIELAVTRESRQVQNDQLRNYLSVNKEVFDQTSFRIKALDDKIAELDKELPGVMSLPPQEAIKRGLEIEMMKQKLVTERKALLDSIPEIDANPYAPANPMGGEFATGPIGNAGRGTRPVTTTPKAARTAQPANTQGPTTKKKAVQQAKSRFGK